jgi:hypothetical protein
VPLDRAKLVIDRQQIFGDMRAPVAEDDSQLVIVTRRKGIRAGGYLCVAATLAIRHVRSLYRGRSFP